MGHGASRISLNLNFPVQGFSINLKINRENLLLTFEAPYANQLWKSEQKALN